jgi:transposase-like protein
MIFYYESNIIKDASTLFEEKPYTVEKYECEGCKFNRSHKHNGKYAKIMNWSKNKVIRFVDLVD